MTANEATPSVAPNTLYIVSTPIGNLKDITLRALEVLAAVDLIAAEDTRHSQILLNHYQIQTKTVSYHDFNKEKRTPALLEHLKSGQSLAVISDAGTPGVSDPAFYLVRAAIAEQIKVVAIPGASAVLTALIVSGLATDRFVFEGFLPVKKGRNKRLTELANETRTMVFYESPNRVARTCSDLYQAFGNRPAALARELTKIFEQVLRSSLKELIDQMADIKLKGEFVIVVAGTGKAGSKKNSTDD